MDHALDPAAHGAADMANPLTVVQFEHLDVEAVEWLRERCTVIQVDPESTDSAEHLARADGMIVRTYTTVDRALLARAPRLRVVGRAGTGLDNIDCPACRSRNVQVVYTPDSNGQAVAEYVMCLIGDALRPRPALDHAVAADAWRVLRADHVAPKQMNELTLGILGLGRIGRRVARTASSIGFHVLYNDLLEIPMARREGADPVSVEALFEQSDVLSVHIDGRPENRGFVGHRLLSCMKPNAVFLNTSRGFVMETADLAAHLRAQPGARAYLDVHDPEPFDDEYPLLGLPSATLYPHLASRTAAAMRDMSWVVRDVWAVLDGRSPRYPAPS